MLKRLVAIAALLTALLTFAAPAGAQTPASPLQPVVDQLAPVVGQLNPALDQLRLAGEDGAALADALRAHRFPAGISLSED